MNTKQKINAQRKSNKDWWVAGATIVALVLIGLIIQQLLSTFVAPTLVLSMIVEEAKQTEAYKKQEIVEKTRDAVPSRGGLTRLENMEITAYTCGVESTGKKPGHPAYGITASGHRLTKKDAYKAVAADPAHYYFGQQLYIDGVGTVTVLDTGGDIKGKNRLDLYVGENVQDALNWGRQTRGVAK